MIRYGTALLLVMALAVSASATAATNATADADAAAVRSIGETWQRYYRAGNYAAIPELYTEDTVVMPRGRPRIEGREHLRRALGGLAAGRRVEIEVKEYELNIVGDVAWYVGDFRVTYVSKDPAIPPKVEFGRSLIIYKRGSDGRWRIHRDIDAPAPTPAGEGGAANAAH